MITLTVEEVKAIILGLEEGGYHDADYSIIREQVYLLLEKLEELGQ